MAAHPHLVLIGVLVALILITGAVRPTYLTFSGLRNSALFAVPIGIMAAGQTMLMLTGGIDLSVAMIATGAAYVAASQSPEGAAIAIGAGLVVGFLAGAANGIGVGVFRVNPLIMTLAMSAILLGLFTTLGADHLLRIDEDARVHPHVGGRVHIRRSPPLGGDHLGGIIRLCHPHAQKIGVRAQPLRPW